MSELTGDQVGAVFDAWQDAGLDPIWERSTGYERAESRYAVAAVKIELNYMECVTLRVSHRGLSAYATYDFEATTVAIVGRVFEAVRLAVAAIGQVTA